MELGTMTHAGYFEGIGGFSLGAEWAGLETTYTCELDDFRNRWLQTLFPNATHERDITMATGQYADIFTGGFPCQDISCANPKGQGLSGSRSGLWFNFFGQITRHRPKYLVIENSPNLVHKGLVVIVEQLTDIGYVCEWDCFHKQIFGFPDRRKRLLLVAYPYQERRQSNKRLFDKIAYEVCRKKVVETKHLWVEADGVGSLEVFGKTLTDNIQTDSGLSRGLVKAEIEAYGDAICPYIAQLIFELIKIHNKTTTTCLEK
jgi:DNA (cytosine-5)-methyltransferase 1